MLVGGKKLPEMMRGLGKGVREFKDGMKERPEEAPNGEESVDTAGRADDTSDAKE